VVPGDRDRDCLAHHVGAHLREQVHMELDVWHAKLYVGTIPASGGLG